MWKMMVHVAASAIAQSTVPMGTGQGGCVACSFNGIRIKYQKAIKILNDADMTIANFVCQNNYYKLDELFDFDVFVTNI